VGAEELEEDDEPFEQKMERLTNELEEQLEESDKLNQLIKQNLGALGHVK
jgi:type I restriction enzyme M protein